MWGQVDISIPLWTVSILPPIQSQESKTQHSTASDDLQTDAAPLILMHHNVPQNWHSHTWPITQSLLWLYILAILDVIELLSTLHLVPQDGEFVPFSSHSPHLWDVKTNIEQLSDKMEKTYV